MDIKNRHRINEMEFWGKQKNTVHPTNALRQLKGEKENPLQWY